MRAEANPDRSDMGWKIGMSEGEMELALGHCRARSRAFNRRGQLAQAAAFAEAGRRFRTELSEREEAMSRDWELWLADEQLYREA